MHCLLVRIHNRHSSKVLTGISITETAADGTSTQSVENISVFEANFKFKEVFSSFSIIAELPKITLTRLHQLMQPQVRARLTVT